MKRDDYFQDGRLEIVILGPMRKSGQIINQNTKDAADKILDESTIKSKLSENGIGTVEVTYPEEWMDNIIQEGVFNKLDTADLVILNITPKKGDTDSPNVMYELAIVQSLGLPYIIILERDFKRPFYARLSKSYSYDTEDVNDLLKTLRKPLTDFILQNSTVNFISSPISKFYEDLPIVDISAAVGLATGYYMNFMRRVLIDHGIRQENRDKMKHFIYVRPDNVIASYPAQEEKMEKILSDAGLKLIGESIPGVQSDNFGCIWINHIDGIICDMPRMIFPLKISPRLMSLRRRATRGMTSLSNQNDSKIRQVSERLLDRIEAVIHYHIQHETDSIDESMLHFSTFEELPKLVKSLTT